MALSWNEIKSRAVEFSKEWENETYEKGEAQSFWNDFFEVFGIKRKRVGLFEHYVEKLGKKKGFIDLFWPAVLVAEAKSLNEDLDKAFNQVLDYITGLTDHEAPKYILISDFGRIRLFDIEENKKYEFKLNELVNNVKLFSFIAGYTKKEYKPEDPVNIKAAELMGRLYDSLLLSNYDPHQLKLFLVRILFCLFADDTLIFEKGIFREYIDTKTKEDGSDMGLHLGMIFQIVNTPDDKRQNTLDEDLARFPYVNGGLFEETITLPSFNSEMRNRLLECCDSDWTGISPAIFGSMFQSVMDKKSRRALGAHYTSETNILKLIKPLFLDELWDEFHKVKKSNKGLKEFYRKIGELKFLDPACGCGNFLIIAYRELRLLELEVIKEMTKLSPIRVQTSSLLVSVDHFYGIELEEFPARIAQTAMWLMEHQMDQKFAETLGAYLVRLPLQEGARIVNKNALRVDWEEVVPKSELSYILGNPPFIGQHLQEPDQKEDMDIIFKGIKGYGVLDYVSAWYIKAAIYIKDTQIKVAFVSTNSITQGEQVSVLWNELLYKYGIKIHFAHKTFKWSNEARGKAAVYCVIIGFANFDTQRKLLYEYEQVKGEPHEIKVKNISPYLVNSEDIIIGSRTKPISNSPVMVWGNKPVDGGFLMFTPEEKDKFTKDEPQSEKYFRRVIGADEFLYNKIRWCLWLKNVKPEELRSSPKVLEAIRNVKEFRLASKKEATKKIAAIPSIFGEIRQPETDYILLPSTSSENRKYIPIGFVSKDIIVNNSCHIIPDANLYHFGILECEMHMAWVKHVCGRLESRFRYSKDIVYNNFPWPENPSPEKVKAIEVAAQKVLDVRAKSPNSSLADLYDQLTMPPDLLKAHQELDKAVDLAYTRKSFKSDAERLEFLFELYKNIIQNVRVTSAAK